MISFWQAQLDKKEEAKLQEQLKNMPEECRNLYYKFVKLRHQTKSLKQSLGKMKN